MPALPSSPARHPERDLVQGLRGSARARRAFESRVNRGALESSLPEEHVARAAAPHQIERGRERVGGVGVLQR